MHYLQIVCGIYSILLTEQSDPHSLGYKMKTSQGKHSIVSSSSIRSGSAIMCYGIVI